MDWRFWWLLCSFAGIRIRGSEAQELWTWSAEAALAGQPDAAQSPANGGPIPWSPKRCAVLEHSVTRLWAPGCLHRRGSSGFSACFLREISYADSFQLSVNFQNANRNKHVITLVLTNWFLPSAQTMSERGSICSLPFFEWNYYYWADFGQLPGTQCVERQNFILDAQVGLKNVNLAQLYLCFIFLARHILFFLKKKNNISSTIHICTYTHNFSQIRITA